MARKFCVITTPQFSSIVLKPEHGSEAFIRQSKIPPHLVEGYEYFAYVSGYAFHPGAHWEIKLFERTRPPTFREHYSARDHNLMDYLRKMPNAVLLMQAEPFERFRSLCRDAVGLELYSCSEPLSQKE